MEGGHILGLREMKYRRLLAIMAIAASQSARSEAPAKVSLRADQCRAALDEVIASLDHSWRHLRPFVQACPVRAPNGSMALSVLTIRVDRIIATAAVQRWSEGEPPEPLIIDSQGRVVGQLPEPFPENPPPVWL